MKIDEINLNKKEYSKEILEYFEKYKLNYKNVIHHFGYINSIHHNLAVHIFLPENYQSISIFVHGYLDHSGTFSRFTGDLLLFNQAVVIFDLPGHGLSSGERTAIEDFSIYTLCLKEIISFVKANFNSKINLAGFSTGCAVIYDYLINNPDIFNKIIFVAPLLRIRLWSLTKISNRVLKKFIKSVPRVFRKVSHDRDFLNFLQYEDKFQDRILSLKWVENFFKWEEKTGSFNNLEQEVLLIQGDKDQAVWWEYNLSFYKNKISNLKIEMIENGYHQLLNEEKFFYNQVIKKIKKYLENS